MSARDVDKAVSISFSILDRIRLGGGSYVGSGTGFVVETSGMVATNNHVVKDCIRVTVSGAGIDHTDPIAASIQAIDRKLDLALLKVSMEFRIASKLSPSSVVELGNSVIVAGYPLFRRVGTGFNVTSGIVSATSGYRGNVEQFQFTAPVQPGNSGGPVLDGAGNVVGVAVSKVQLGAVENVGFGIRGSVLRSFLEANDINYELSDVKEQTNIQRIATVSKQFTVSIQCWN